MCGTLSPFVPIMWGGGRGGGPVGDKGDKGDAVHLTPFPLI